MEKYNISFSVAKEYLKYLYYIDLNNNYDSKKISFLQEMKKDLTNNNILIENKQFKEYLNSKNVYVDASNHPFLHSFYISPIFIIFKCYCNALSIAFALSRVSSYSAPGSESAVIPPPTPR